MMPEFKSYDKFSIDKIGFHQSTLSVNLHYFNPNKLGVILDKTDFDIYLNDNLLGHSSQKLHLPIAKKSEFIIPLKVSVEMKNLLKNSLAGLLNKEVRIRIIGKIRLGKGKIFTSFPVDYSSVQSISL